MLAVAAVLGDRHLVFPKAAALTFGVIGIRVDAWRASPAALLVALSGVAALGVALAPLPARERCSRSQP